MDTAPFIGADDVPYAEPEKPRNEWIGQFSVPRLSEVIELSVSLFKPLGYDFEGRCISALD